jgi:hypothetical protein
MRRRGWLTLCSLVVSCGGRSALEGAQSFTSNADGGGSSRAGSSNGGTKSQTFIKGIWATRGAALSAVAVDGSMGLTLAGYFSGTFEADDQTFTSSSNDVPDLWVAHYSREGKLAWQQAFSSEARGATVSSAVADPFGNVVLAGGASYLKAAGTELKPDPKLGGKALFALKLRPTGEPIWLRSFDGMAYGFALAVDRQGQSWLGGNIVGKLSLGGEQLDPMGNIDAFLLRLGP